VLGSLWRLQPTLPAAPSLLPEPTLRWTAAWGAEMVEAARAALAEPPMLDLALKVHADTDVWAERLGGTSLAPGHVRLPRGSAIETLDGYADGDWWVQDLASTLPVRAMGAANGRTVLDLCAAPGGKTMQLAAAGWDVTALDLSAKRMALLDSNLERTGLKAAAIIADLRKWESETQYDAVLLDAPCSATGTFRRHPDVLHRIGERQIAELVELQASLLGHAATRVNPGGMFVFATCSLEPEEGEAQAAAFLDSHSDFAVEPIDTALLPAAIAAQNGQVRALPGMYADQGGLDGFFVAAFTRSG
jgi:16S rRNA (cytosine967-C5)-methyltransferase